MTFVCTAASKLPHLTVPSFAMPLPFGLGIKEKPKNPAEVVAKLYSALEVFDQEAPKTVENVAKSLGAMKLMLFGDEGKEPVKEHVMALASEACKTNLLLLLVRRLSQFEFEARKDAAQVFGALARIRESDEKCCGSMYIQHHPEVLDMLFAGYDDANIALNCGSMLRDCIRDEAAARMVLDSPIFMKFFEKVEVANFEIASDAFSTFKDLLTRHKAAVSKFLTEGYLKFFEPYSKLLQSSNYVTRRQSLKLLGEMLLDRSNVKVMIKYISEAHHLMQIMMLLKDQSRSIQYEAFHVFKVFVANPNKPQPIIDILANNKDKLLKYLEDFHTDKDDDELFKEEKAVIIKEISGLHTQPPASS